jgi:hypothetical protein
MAKQTFTTGQVLTAAQMTSLQQTAMGGGSTTAKTTSYTLVAADAGTVVQMNSASATTITVNTSLFAAGDTVQIQNIGAGVCTVTAGTATVNTAGSLALSQYEGGQLYFTAASAALFFDTVQAAAATTTLTARKTANQSVTSNTTVANDTHLTFAVAASEVWFFDLFLTFTGSSSGASNFKATMNGPAGATIVWSYYPNIFNNAAAAVDRTHPNALGVTEITYADNTAITIGIKGIIVNGVTAGSCTLQWAQGTSNANASTLNTNSYLVATKGA